MGHVFSVDPAKASVVTAGTTILHIGSTVQVYFNKELVKN